MKTFITALGLVTAGATALAQGYINILNTPPTFFHTNTVAFGGSSGNMAGASRGFFYFEVLTAPSTVTSVDASLRGLLSGTWSDTGVSGTNTALAGRVLGEGPTSANNWAVGVQQSFIVVGWSANLGSTWAQVRDEALPFVTLQGANGSYYWHAEDILYSGFLGATTVGSAIAGQDTNSAARLFGNPVISDPQVPIPILTTTELYSVSVPEPGTLALASLGAGGLYLFRRRR
jgi:hypothetical protein